MTVAYVSGTKALPRIHITPVKRAIIPETHRQLRSLRGIHRTSAPTSAQWKALGQKKPRARPLDDAGKISAITPPALVSVDEPKQPAKNRKMRSVPGWLAPVQPAAKAVNTLNVTKKMIWRPYSSERGPRAMAQERNRARKAIFRLWPTVCSWPDRILIQVMRLYSQYYCIH